MTGLLGPGQVWRPAAAKLLGKACSAVRVRQLARNSKTTLPQPCLSVSPANDEFASTHFCLLFHNDRTQPALTAFSFCLEVSLRLSLASIAGQPNTTMVPPSTDFSVSDHNLLPASTHVRPAFRYLRGY